MPKPASEACAGWQVPTQAPTYLLQKECTPLRICSVAFGVSVLRSQAQDNKFEPLSSTVAAAVSSLTARNHIYRGPQILQ